MQNFAQNRIEFNWPNGTEMEEFCRFFSNAVPFPSLALTTSRQSPQPADNRHHSADLKTVRAQTKRGWNFLKHSIFIEWASDGVWSSVWSEVQIVCIMSSWCHCIPKAHNLLPHLNPDCFYLLVVAYSGSGLPRVLEYSTPKITQVMFWYSSTRLIQLPVGNFNFRFQFSKLMSSC